MFCVRPPAWQCAFTLSIRALQHLDFVLWLWQQQQHFVAAAFPVHSYMSHLLGRAQIKSETNTFLSAIKTVTNKRTYKRIVEQRKVWMKRVRELPIHTFLSKWTTTHSKIKRANKNKWEANGHGDCCCGCDKERPKNSLSLPLRVSSIAQLRCYLFWSIFRSKWTKNVAHFMLWELSIYWV